MIDLNANRPYAHRYADKVADLAHELDALMDDLADKWPSDRPFPARFDEGHLAAHRALTRLKEALNS